MPQKAQKPSCLLNVEVIRLEPFIDIHSLKSGLSQPDLLRILGWALKISAAIPAPQPRSPLSSPVQGGLPLRMRHPGIPHLLQRP